MSDWVLILGCSTGHGGATAKRLAEDGYGIIGFHFDRGDVKKEAEALIHKISSSNNGKVHFWNINAAAIETMDEYIPKIAEITGGNPVKLLLHSIAFGTTTNFFSDKSTCRSFTFNTAYPQASRHDLVVLKMAFERPLFFNYIKQFLFSV